jgi:hypothetical protein
MRYCKVDREVTPKISSIGEPKEPKYVFREYLSGAIAAGVVVVESAASVPPRRLFRYDWMHVNLSNVPFTCQQGLFGPIS